MEKKLYGYIRKEQNRMYIRITIVRERGTKGAGTLQEKRYLLTDIRVLNSNHLKMLNSNDNVTKQMGIEIVMGESFTKDKILRSLKYSGRLRQDI